MEYLIPINPTKEDIENLKRIKKEDIKRRKHSEKLQKISEKYKELGEGRGQILIAELKPGAFAKKVQGEIITYYVHGLEVKTLGIGQVIFIPYREMKKYKIIDAPTRPGLPKQFTG